MEPKPIKIESAVKVISYLIGVIAYIPLAVEISPFYSVAFWVLLALAIYQERHAHFLLPRYVLTLVSFIFLALAFLRLNREEVVVPIIDALTIFMAIKFLEDKKFRDYMQIYVIAVFMLAGYALMSIDLIFVGYVIVLLMLFTVASILLTYHAQSPTLELDRKTLKTIIKRSIWIPILSIPVAVIIFTVIPRTTNPFFNFLNVGSKARSGFSDTVTLGQVSDIQNDESVIFRAKMERVPAENLYWRGVILNYFDGNQWESRVPPVAKARQYLDGERIKQTIFLEPYGQRYLFALDTPYRAYAWRVNESEGLTFTMPFAIYHKYRYEAISILSDLIFVKTIPREIYLQLPENFSPRIRELATKLAVSGDEVATIDAIYRHLQSAAFSYTLDDLPVSASPIETFLFDKKTGNCEYFASSMVLLLRAAGIPARMVGGYLGGEYNSSGGYYLVTQKNAHTWVEAYLEGIGWARYDPTPAEAASIFDNDYFYRLKLLFDSLNFYWNSFVINYDFQTQFELLRALRDQFQRPKMNVSLNQNQVMRYIVMGIGLIVLFGFLRTYLSRRQSPAEKVMAAFLATLSQRGYEKQPHQGLEEFVATITDPELQTKAHQFVRRYESFYYRDQEIPPAEIESLQHLIKNFPDA